MLVALVTFAGEKNELSVEEQCKKAVDKLVSLIKKDPARKRLVPKLKKIAQMENKRCIKKFRKDVVDCIIISETFDEARECKNTKKSGLLNKRECEKMITHMFNLMQQDPKIKMETEALRKYYKKSEIKKCYHNYNKDYNLCILKSKKYSDMEKCKNGND
ncbi:hypothetical protein ACFL20_07555 [Spirochaetota bacterium]